MILLWQEAMIKSRLDMYEKTGHSGTKYRNDVSAMPKEVRPRSTNYYLPTYLPTYLLSVIEERVGGEARKVGSRKIVRRKGIFY